MAPGAAAHKAAAVIRNFTPTPRNDDGPRLHPGDVLFRSSFAFSSNGDSRMDMFAECCLRGRLSHMCSGSQAIGSAPPGVPVGLAQGPCVDCGAQL